MKLVLALATTLALCAGLASGVAAADTVHFGKATLSTPDDGWTVSTSNGVMTLGNKAGGFIELYDFSKVPAADKAALTKLIAARPGTSAVVIEAIKPDYTQGTHKGLLYKGTGKMADKAVKLGGVALDGFGQRAVFALAVMLPGTEKTVGSQIEAILLSLH